MSDTLGARIVIKASFISPRRGGQGQKNGKKGGSSGTYAQYIGTREGAVKIADSQRGEPETKGQRKLIDEIVKEIPEAKRLLSYGDYQSKKTQGRATDFITDALDNYGYKVENVSGYAQYMATRPMANKTRNNGLFSDGDKPVDMKALKKELDSYTGAIYLPIISLREQDSVGLGYDNPKAWHDLVERHLDDFAKQWKIPRDHLRWVAAYHNAVNSEGVVHNHIHMMIWSTNPGEGWQGPETANNMRKILAKDIFGEELNKLYTQKDVTKKELKEEAAKKIDELTKSIAGSTVVLETPEIRAKRDLIKKELQMLAEDLKNYEGRAYYKYLSPKDKQLVDRIANDMVDADPRMKELLEAYADYKDRQMRIYCTDHYELPPISEIKDFKPIKNQIINAAVQMAKDEGLKVESEPDHTNKRGRKKKNQTQASTPDDKPRASQRAKAASDRALSRITQALSKIADDKSGGAGGRAKPLSANKTEEDEEMLHSIGLK